MDPESGARRPEMHSTVVVFPAPLGPMIPNISPSRREKDTSSTAARLPYRLTRFLTVMTGCSSRGFWALSAITDNVGSASGRLGTSDSQLPVGERELCRRHRQERHRPPVRLHLDASCWLECRRP